MQEKDDQNRQPQPEELLPPEDALLEQSDLPAESFLTLLPESPLYGVSLIFGSPFFATSGMIASRLLSFSTPLWVQPTDTLDFTPPPFPSLPPTHHAIRPADKPAIEPDAAPDIGPLFGISDPLFPTQWALYNRIHPGVDINVVKVWEDYTGDGVILGVIDDGLEYTHPELSANYLPAYGYDVLSGTNDPAPRSAANNHGTSVTSMAAAARNGIGMVGVAYDVSFSMVRIDYDEDMGPQEITALRHSAYADTVNMSYGGIPQYGFYNYPISNAEYESLATNGREGLGSVLVNAVGNDRDSYVKEWDEYHSFMNTIDAMNSQPWVISVAAIENTGKYAYFSSPGPTILVSAPGLDVWAADREAPNGYAADSSYDLVPGTSFAAPIVAGVVALMLEANPALGYRDVQSILAMTARKAGNAVSDPDWGWDWQINGAENVNGGGMHASHDYGYGLVDALAAVRLAESWDQEANTAADLMTVTQTVSPSLQAGGTGSLTSTMTIGQDIDVEHVVAELTISGGKVWQLSVILESPDGTNSYLLANTPDQWADDPDFTHTFTDSNSHPFGSTQCRGEDGQGVWTLTINDTETDVSHTLESWTLTLYGETPDANDLYVYTNEFSDMLAQDSSRAILSDASGTDTINAAAVSSASIINLTGGTTSTIDGAAITIEAGTTIENAHTGDGDDKLFGNSADNQLFGWRGDDYLIGNAGADSLFGGVGSDILTGGSGADIFRYQSVNHGGDTVTDFSHADDLFGFDYARFGQPGTGTLAADRFFTSEDNVNVNDDCFIFEGTALYYDADGTGSGASVLIAQVSGDAVHADDITFV